MTYSTPSLSVIVASYNRPKTLLRLLDQLNNQRCVDFRSIDCCVVEDGSNESVFLGDQLKDLEEEDYCEVVQDYKYSLFYIYRKRHPDDLARVYSSRNLAARNTKGEYILQLDDDVEFHPYLLNMLQSMAGMAQEEHWVWTPRISDNKDWDKDGHSADHNWDRGPDGRWWDGRVAWQESHWGSADSSGMFMPRRTWEAVGGYSEEFDLCMGCGDQEVALKIQKLGEKPGDVKLWIAPYFVNKADEEGGSLRMTMIDRALKMGRERNEDIFNRKYYPEAYYDNGAKGTWTDIY